MVAASLLAASTAAGCGTSSNEVDEPDTPVQPAERNTDDPNDDGFDDAEDDSLVEAYGAPPDEEEADDKRDEIDGTMVPAYGAPPPEAPEPSPDTAPGPNHGTAPALEPSDTDRAPAPAPAYGLPPGSNE